MSNSSIWLIDTTLSGATAPDQYRPGSDGNEIIPRISQSSSSTGALSSDCLMSYLVHSLKGGGSYSFTDMQSVFSTALVDYDELPFYPVCWGCRIHRLLFCRRLRPPLHHNECPDYDIKQCDGELPVTLELWGMLSTPSLPSLPGSLWPGVVVPDRVLSMGQIEPSCVLMQNWTVWNRTVFDI